MVLRANYDVMEKCNKLQWDAMETSKSGCDGTQPIRMWWNPANRHVMEPSQSGCDGNQPITMWWNPANHDMMEPSQSGCDGTQPIRMWWNPANKDVLEPSQSGCEGTQLITMWWCHGRRTIIMWCPLANQDVFIGLLGVYRPTRSRIFHSYGDVTITGEGLQILTYARHSWPMSSEGSLRCCTYCDMGHPFIMVISEDPWHLHLLLNVKQWSANHDVMEPCQSKK